MALRYLLGLQGPLGWTVFVTVGLVFIVVLPVLNLAVDPASPWHVGDFLISILGKFLCFALLAMALDLLWGYCGALSLGHGAFFALGGYCMGMHLMRQIGDRGVYGHPVLPDFMVFLNWDELPWYWYGFDQFWFAVIMALAVPGALAGALGWLAFRSRITGVYFSILTQAMVFAMGLAFFRNEMGFGGNNGLTDFRDILGFDLRTSETRAGLLVASAIALGLGFLICRAIVKSKFGQLMVAIRDAESRVRFLGYPVTGAKLFVFVVSAMLAGLAGALYVPQVGIINPGEFSTANSIEVAVWVAVGGRGTLAGPIVGAVGVNWIESWLGTVAPDLWLFFLGALFVGVTLFLPRGIAGLVGDLGSLLRRGWRSGKPGGKAPAHA